MRNAECQSRRRRRWLCFHGTHVAGIALGSSFNGGSAETSNVSGVAPDAGLVAVQVFSRFTSQEICGSTTPCAIAYNSDVAAGLEWIYDNRDQFNLSAVNLSLGGDGAQRTACNDHPLREIVRNLREEGIATVIASGNDGNFQAVSSPACIAEAVTVGSSRADSALPDFSRTLLFWSIYSRRVLIYFRLFRETMTLERQGSIHRRAHRWPRRMSQEHSLCCNQPFQQLTLIRSSLH